MKREKWLYPCQQKLNEFLEYYDDTSCSTQDVGDNFAYEVHVVKKDNEVKNLVFKCIWNEHLEKPQYWIWVGNLHNSGFITPEKR